MKRRASCGLHAVRVGAQPRRVRRCAWRSDPRVPRDEHQLDLWGKPEGERDDEYGELAKRHWTRTDPARVQAMTDPETFFRELGEQVETQVQQLMLSLAGPDQPGEEYLQKVGRLNMARLQAEEVVLTALARAPTSADRHGWA